ncbi:Crp/Fnr family transcriptional regulator [Phenylobacterium sp. J426]|uniref:Crp/Fnr family transcriptional regulator n=1 Tax=Phenylobacterium sp. J426 TaxID=2898439 RepID=UPI002151E43A|nr:Crp/Fnr family transcriptional regulator [Phenylobacterium sp. J426]MCR5876617.1 Crp/Fnr family transcriptional regulator [Phenylobacterium sp. J426]
MQFGANGLLRVLAIGEAAPLLARAEPVRLQTGQALLQPGERPSHVIFPLVGLVAQTVASAEGRVAGVSLIGAEGGVGIVEAAGRAPVFSTFRVQAPGAGLRLAAELLVEALEVEARARAAFQRYAAIRSAEHENWIACAAFASAEARLAMLLLLARERGGDGRVVPLTQEFLAEMLGMQRTTVTQAASQFASRGVIRTLRGRVELLDVDALREAAAVCLRDLEAFRRKLEALPI